jgi:hypothetical protein
MKNSSLNCGSAFFPYFALLKLFFLLADITFFISVPFCPSSVASGLVRLFLLLQLSDSFQSCLLKQLTRINVLYFQFIILKIAEMCGITPVFEGHLVLGE